MTRTIIIAAITAAVVAALAVTGTLLITGSNDSAAAPTTAASSSPAAPAGVVPPATFTTGTPEYEQLIACMYGAGYGDPGADMDASQLIVKGPGLPTLRFDVSGASVTPATATDITVLRTAGCLS